MTSIDPSFNKPSSTKKAIVLVSGGLDSATVLAMAIADGYECHTLSFDYGQRHRAELLAAEQLSTASAAVEHRPTHLLGPEFRINGRRPILNPSAALRRQSLILRLIHTETP